MTSIKKQFDQLEQTMVRNIANSLFQMHFHQNATAEEMMKYYGWQTPFEESERENLIQETLGRLESERLILEFYKKNKSKLNKLYGNKNPTGDLNLPPKHPTGSGSEQTSISENAGGNDEGGPQQGTASGSGHANATTETDNGGNEI